MQNRMIALLIGLGLVWHTGCAEQDDPGDSTGEHESALFSGSWTASEEQQFGLLMNGYAAAGIQCRGNNCDDISIFECPVVTL